MDRKNPFEIKFHNEYVNLIENLLKIFKPDRELSRYIKNSYLDYKKDSDRFTFIHETVERMSTYIDAVRNHDESIFALDENETVFLLANLDFRRLWGSELLEVNYKTVVWKYLTNLYVVGCHYIDRQDDGLRKLVKQIKLDKYLQKKVVEDEDISEQEKSQLSQEIAVYFKELFGPDSFIQELFYLNEVQAIIAEFKASPINTFKSYTSNNGQRFKEVMTVISSQIKSKILNGELDKTKIERDIEKVRRLVNKLKSELPNDPRFGKIFEQIKKSFNIDLTSEEAFSNPEALFKQMSQKFETACGVSMEELSNKTPEELESTFKAMGQEGTDLQELVQMLETDFANDNDDASHSQLLETLRRLSENVESSSLVDVDQSNFVRQTNNQTDNSDLPLLNEQDLPPINDE